MPSLEDIPEDDIEAIATAEATIEEYEKDKEEWWFKLGIYYGTLIYLILYTPDDWSDDHYNPDEYEEEDFIQEGLVRVLATKGMEALL